MRITIYWSERQSRYVSECQDCGEEIDPTDKEAHAAHQCDMTNVHPLKLNLQGASEAGYKDHPSDILHNLGLKVVVWRAETIADSIFVKVRGDVSNLPDFITPAPKYFENVKT